MPWPRWSTTPDVVTIFKWPKPKLDSDTDTILKLLSEQSLTVTMIANRTGIHRTVVRGMLRALLDTGYIRAQAVPPSILYSVSYGFVSGNIDDSARKHCEESDSAAEEGGL